MSSSVVGIDLGFQNSVIAAAGRGGVDVILNGNSNRLNPSMVSFQESRKKGEQAGAGATSNFKNTIRGMKRLIGLAYDDPRALREMDWAPFECVRVKHATGPDSVGVKVNFDGKETVVSAEAVYGMMVKHLGDIAAAKAAASTSTDSGNNLSGSKSLFPQDWVVAVPNYFTDAQRRAVLVGCEICNVSGVLRLMHENTAVSLAYGIFKDLKKVFTKDQPTHVMFIDMGASAYTVSVAAFEPGKLTVKASYTDPELGGRDFDLAIAKWLAKKFQDKYGSKLSASPMEVPKTRLKLLSAAEKAKKTLSPAGVKEARINLEMLQDDYDFSVSLQADEYEAMCQPFLDRLAEPIQLCLAECKLQARDLSSVEIVGGSTRIGCVKRKLIDILGGKQLSTTMNADEAVARGAALQSAILSPRFKVLPYEIQEAQPYPIKISWADEKVASGVEVMDEAGRDVQPTDSVIMFDRGLSFPIVRRVTLRREGNFHVHARYDETASSTYGLPADAGKDICSFTIMQKTDGEKKVRVNIKQDIHGIVHMSSVQMVEEIVEDEAGSDKMNESGGEAGKDSNNTKDPPAAGEQEKSASGDTEEKKKTKIKKTNLEFTTIRPLDWTAQEIAAANEAEVRMENHDRVIRETADMRNELESYIYDMRDRVGSDSHLGPYGTESEKAAFLGKNEATENWLYEDGFDATKSVYAEKLAELRKLGAPLEQRYEEASGRNAAMSQLQGKLEMYQKWSNESQNDPKYKHITDEERQKVRSCCDETSAWMYEQLDKQGGLALYDDPVLTMASIQLKAAQLVETCNPIMNKAVPPPPPPPAPPKKDEAPKEGTGTAADGGGGAEPMEGVESAGSKQNGDAAAAEEDATKMEVDG